MAKSSVMNAILAKERSALDRWSQGDPLGYLEIQTADVTYFDDIAAHSRIDGIDAMRQYMSSLKGQIPAHRYEIVDPKIQDYGEVAVLTLRYHTFDQDGDPLTPWKATSVYRWVNGEWRICHAHWSMVKDV